MIISLKEICVVFILLMTIYFIISILLTNRKIKLYTGTHVMGFVNKECYNICYLNTSLQLFLLFEEVKKHIEKAVMSENQLIRSLYEIIENEKNGRIKTYDSLKIFNALNNELEEREKFTLNNFYSAEVCLNRLLCITSKIFENINEDIDIGEYFNLIYYNFGKCQKCHNIVKKYENVAGSIFYVRNSMLEINQLYLDDFIIRYSEDESEKPVCNKCHSDLYVKKCAVIDKFSLYLQIIITRIDENKSDEVDRRKISIYHTLDVCDVIYNLIGFNLHVKLITGNHFYCYVKKDNVWYKCDDDIIKKVDIKEIDKIISNSNKIFHAIYKKNE